MARNGNLRMCCCPGFSWLRDSQIFQQGEGNPHPHFDSFFNGRKTEHSVFLESRTFWAMSVSDELRLWHPFPTFMRVRPLTHPFGLRDFALRQSSNQASKLTFLPPPSFSRLTSLDPKMHTQYFSAQSHCRTSVPDWFPGRVSGLVLVYVRTGGGTPVYCK